LHLGEQERVDADGAAEDEHFGVDHCGDRHGCFAEGPSGLGEGGECSSVSVLGSSE
jgi:hypothetical protein